MAVWMLSVMIWMQTAAKSNQNWTVLTIIMTRREISLSDKIKITIVAKNDEKLNNSGHKKADSEQDDTLILTHDFSMTVMSTLLENGLVQGSFCGGRGVCGRCRIQFLKGATSPTPIERRLLKPDELRQGYRLACLARPKDNCVIRLALIEEKKVDIVSKMTYPPLKNDHISQENKLTKKRKTDVTKYIVAVDLGTTTIAMQLRDCWDDAVVDTYCEMNPQRSYGADVLSRITASCNGHREALRDMVWEVLKRGMEQFVKKLEYEYTLEEPPLGRENAENTNEITCVINKISCMCIAGNTTMEHLLLGYDAGTLGVSPFTPVEIGLQEIRRPEWNFPIYITPGISTFVGGDIVAGLYALGMLGENEKSCRLLIDLGTNGEMAITDGIRMLVTATAAGPAFEGGASSQVIGTDMIDLTAGLLRQGILDETGLMVEPCSTLTQQDIRNLQLAKAAVRAGIEILWDKFGAEQVDSVYLAGGFGCYLNVEAAFQIGLLPERLRGRVQAVGNTSLEGAYRMADDLQEGRIDKASLEERLSSALSINLAEQDKFEQLYLKYMYLNSN
jgi:uncharacterized 2Fe-2S/4Fe-4S cluster protein (DUF4445 family)